jgi:hypothetical protein
VGGDREEKRARVENDRVEQVGYTTSIARNSRQSANIPPQQG